METAQAGSAPSPNASTGNGEPGTEAPRVGRVRRALGDGSLTRNALLIALIGEMVLFFLLSADFLTVGNLRDVAVESSITGLVCVPLAILLLTGYIDLSVGSVLALGAVVTGLLLNADVNPVLAGAAGVGVGLAIGVTNGVLCSVMGFSAIIVTLGGLTALRGVALAASTTTPTGFGSGFGGLGNGTVAGVPIPVLIVAAAFLVGGFVLRFTVWGRHVYAIGVNREAAFLSGLSVRRLPLIIFAATGAAAGLGGVIQAARLDAAPGGTLGMGFELDVLTAVLLGGVSFGGGRGKIFGVFLGVAFLAILQNGLTLLNVSTQVADVAKGAVLIVAGGLEYLNQRSDSR
jgi:ribose transport system permease protein